MSTPSVPVTAQAQPAQQFPVQVSVTIVFEAKTQEELDFFTSKSQDEDIIAEIKSLCEMNMVKVVSVNGEVIR